MADQAGIPPFFSIAEVAAHFAISKDTVLNMARSGNWGQILQVGNMLLISRQQLADEIARRLANPKDERRRVIEHFDAIVAAESSIRRKEQQDQDKERKRRQSPAGRKADAEALRAQRAAANKDDPNFGTRRSRLSILQPNSPRTNFRPKAPAVPDIETTEEAVLAADPHVGKVPGARVAYVMTDEQLAETRLSPRERR
jgi:hypothetical protein